MPCLGEIFQLFPQSIEEHADLHGDIDEVGLTENHRWEPLKDSEDKDGFTEGGTTADLTEEKDTNKLILQGRVSQPP